ncbi:formate dehydrogenase subunit gamma [Oceanimonas sp. CHS3-5]|uniref:formate dehydrogenase subunit gamma n=1 Tax=Oceanimonas sp. CHS3-5 TaxID=3068186 RepID=UPI00273D0427|nr:formate dehydrogenase subunit gamma [Oceanimonas sp. CHS3-5]MDP5291534.1 formate dehydrogenase subunit gamma [Oceanimonas sp. CHS3-5]
MIVNEVDFLMDEKQVKGMHAIERIVASLRHQPGALLPMLHGIQDELGYIPDDAIPVIAKALRITAADVHGVVSFYHYFRSEQPGRHVVEVCRAEACQARGARELEAHAKARLGIDYGQTTADRNITLKPVYCLGNCATGPSVRVGKCIKSRTTPARFDQLVDELATYKLELK